MTGPDDQTSTRPISVAELLAKNGTIGAPPVGGRRRRRRGNSDAVTVAELTGEIPIIRPDDPAPAPLAEPAPPVEGVADTETTGPPSNGTVDDYAEAEAELDVESEAEAERDIDPELPEPELLEPELAESVTDEAEQVGDGAGPAVVETEGETSSEAEPEIETAPESQSEMAEETPPRRFGFGRPRRRDASGGDAEQMSPDPLDDASTEVDATALLNAANSLDGGVDATAVVNADKQDSEGSAEDDDGLPSYLRSSPEPLFGGQTVADDLARRAGPTREGDGRLGALDEDDLAEQELAEARQMSSFAHGVWVVGQSVLAVVFGAGLFVAFDQLWRWNNIVALVLSVLVILGLVVGVRVVRKTEDIGSTLIAVAVGALVTLGPLALLQSG